MRTVTLAAAVLAIGVIAFIGCTALSTGTTSDAPSSVGAAIAAVFSTGQGGSVLGPQAVSTTCSDFEPGGAGGPDNVTTSASITAGTYGATAASVTVTADQDCESDSNSNDSYAGFTISQDVAGTCADGTTVT